MPDQIPGAGNTPAPGDTEQAARSWWRVYRFGAQMMTDGPDLPVWPDLNEDDQELIQGATAAVLARWYVPAQARVIQLTAQLDQMAAQVADLTEQLTVARRDLAAAEGALAVGEYCADTPVEHELTDVARDVLGGAP